jgi:hypothetical protein
MLPVELWEPSSKSSSIPVDRKYKRGKQGIIISVKNCNDSLKNDPIKLS